MNKDFKINALRTRIKYKLTSLRVGMKGYILEELKATFGKEFLELPMALILETVEKTEEEVKRSSKPIEDIVENNQSIDLDSTLSNKPKITRTPSSILAEKKTITPIQNEEPVQMEELAQKEELVQKEEPVPIQNQNNQSIDIKKESSLSLSAKLKSKGDEHKVFTVPVLKRLPGLRRYGNNDGSSILTEDSIFERRVRKKTKERTNLRGK